MNNIKGKADYEGFIGRWWQAVLGIENCEMILVFGTKLVSFTELAHHQGHKNFSNCKIHGKHLTALASSLLGIFKNQTASFFFFDHFSQAQWPQHVLSKKARLNLNFCPMPGQWAVNSHLQPSRMNERQCAGWTPATCHSTACMICFTIRSSVNRYRQVQA